MDTEWVAWLLKKNGGGGMRMELRWWTDGGAGGGCETEMDGWTVIYFRINMCMYSFA